MIKQYITQALAQLRQHPIISAVSIIGTALAIPARKAMKIEPAEALHDE